ncbi:MAG: transglycosylase SLT domain-containing protein [Prevotellaceae bacterium]|jgi:membrane-bound lytic murein transglycosylase D|nr:transglycosylase SLT domain-containing protein [Prevotellaceae bacterium]
MAQIINRIKIHRLGMVSIIPFLFFPYHGYSQEINTKALFNVPKETAADAETDERQNRHAANTAAMDTSSTMWLIQKALYDTSGIVLLKEEELPPADMPDSVYIRRLSAMPSIISLPYNSIVRNYIVYYMQKHPRHSEIMLGLAEYYLPIFEEILDAYNIPLEIKALPIVESALNPVIVSRAGATGMWQFMLSTGRRYGLTINTYVDERRDPVASTYAAAKYLSALYTMFQDWTLALAAYNCGEGTVLKAITRADGKRDYWEIYPYLPKETRNYVPLFVAASYAITYYREHQLTPERGHVPVITDTFMVNSKLHFEQVANTINIPIATLRELNPQYRRDVVPGNERPYELRIPSNYTNAFIENEREIYSHNEAKYFNPNIVVNPTTVAKGSKSASGNSAAISGGEQISHQVKSGESLGTIAGKYKVKLNDLCSWNKLNANSTIYPGQKLVIYGKSVAPKQTANKDVPVSQTEKYHTIEQGDSFWSISQKYNVDIDRLLAINNMTKNSKLLPGKKILLPL